MSHPLAGEVTIRAAFGDIPMLSHALESSHRGALAQAEGMRGQLAALRQALKDSQATSACRLAECQRRIREQDAQFARIQEVESELRAARDRVASLEPRPGRSRRTPAWSHHWSRPKPMLQAT
jgi:hypothetical protein